MKFSPIEKHFENIKYHIKKIKNFVSSNNTPIQESTSRHMPNGTAENTFMVDQVIFKDCFPPSFILKMRFIFWLALFQIRHLPTCLTLFFVHAVMWFLLSGCFNTFSLLLALSNLIVMYLSIVFLISPPPH